MNTASHGEFSTPCEELAKISIPVNNVVWKLSR